jgi:hypothetical protein
LDCCRGAVEASNLREGFEFFVEKVGWPLGSELARKWMMVAKVLGRWAGLRLASELHESEDVRFWGS